MLKSCRVHTTLPVFDLPRARVFYENTLGIPPTTELPTGIFYECGERTRFVLSQTPGKPSGAHTQLAFVVGDIVSEVMELKARGVVFEEYDSPTLRTVDSIADGSALAGSPASSGSCRDRIAEGAQTGRIAMERIVLVCDRCGAQDAHPVQLLIGRRKLVTDLCDGHLSELTSAARAPRRGRAPGPLAARPKSTRRRSTIGRTTRKTPTQARKTRARPRAATLRTGAQDVASQVTKLRERGLSYRQIGDALMESGIKPRRAARWNRDVLARMVSQSAA